MHIAALPELVFKSLGLKLQFLVKNSKFIRELEGKLVDRNAEFPSAAAEEVVGKGSLIYMHLKFLFASILKFYF